MCSVHTYIFIYTFVCMVSWFSIRFLLLNKVGKASIIASEYLFYILSDYIKWLVTHV